MEYLHSGQCYSQPVACLWMSAGCSVRKQLENWGGKGSSHQHGAQAGDGGADTDHSWGCSLRLGRRSLSPPHSKQSSATCLILLLARCMGISSGVPGTELPGWAAAARAPVAEPELGKSHQCLRNFPSEERGQQEGGGGET